MLALFAFLACASYRVVFLAFPLMLMAGCTAISSWETESGSPDFVDGTRVLGEVILIATRDQTLAGEGLFSGWRDKLLIAGYSDDDIQDGSEATIWSYCYGHNSGVPLCAHHGHYIAHVPEELREGLNSDHSANPEGRGDLVEVELVRTPTGAIVGTLVAVYRKADDWAPCREAGLERGAGESAFLAVAGVGPPRAQWIECDDSASDGWTRRPVVGAPLSRGPPVSQWIKLQK